MTMTDLRHGARILLALGALAPSARAANLPDPPEMPPELLPHCTWNWRKVDMSRFELRDGLVCAGRQCLDEGFYDGWSLNDCGMDDELADDVMWAHIVRPGKRDPRFVQLREKLTRLADEKARQVQAATDAMEACLQAGAEATLLSQDQARRGAAHCDSAVQAMVAGILPASDAGPLSKANMALNARLAATGAK